MLCRAAAVTSSVIVGRSGHMWAALLKEGFFAGMGLRLRDQLRPNSALNPARQ